MTIGLGGVQEPAMASGGAVFEAGVTVGSSRVEGTLSVDLEAGSVGWYPLGARQGDAIGLQDDDDSGSCGGCLTWEGAPSLPLEIRGGDLVGASPCPSDAKTYPSFKVFYFVEEVSKRRGGRSRRRLKVTDEFLCSNTGLCEECVDKIRECAGHARSRKGVMVVVNPVSGAGRGLRAARELLGPCLEASGAKHDVTVTREPGEAKTIAASLDIDAYDTLVVVGGDGTMHEALQGLCGRPDADRRAADLAFAVVPTGSGNGFAASIGALDAETAAWGIFRNARRPLDVCSVVQDPWNGADRKFMFLTLTFGFISDLDLDTESLRFLGQARFTLGAVYQMLAGRTTDARVAYVSSGEVSEGEGGGGLGLRFVGGIASSQGGSLKDPPPPWRVLDQEKFQLFVLSNVPCMSMGDRVAPTQDPSSGSLSMVTTGRNGRLKNIGERERGRAFDRDPLTL